MLITESSNMAPHGKELSEDRKRRIAARHEYGQDYKKIANTLKLSCSTVAKIIQHFKRVRFTQNRPRVGRPKKLSARAERYIQMPSLKDRRGSAVSIAAKIDEVGSQPVSAQIIRRTLHQIGVHGCHPRRKTLLKTIHKKACKQFVEDMSTKHIDYWNHVLWSDEMKINLFDSNGFKHVWRRPGDEYKDKCVMPTVKHGGGNVMVWGCMSAAWVGELHFTEGNLNSNMYCEHDPLSPETGSQCSVPAWQWPRTHLQDDHCFTEEAEGKGNGLAKHVSGLEPNRTSLENPQAEDGGAQSLKYPPSPPRRYERVEEHSSGYLWSSGKLHAQESKGSSG